MKSFILFLLNSSLHHRVLYVIVCVTPTAHYIYWAGRVGRTPSGRLRSGRWPRPATARHYLQHYAPLRLVSSRAASIRSASCPLCSSSSAVVVMLCILDCSYVFRGFSEHRCLTPLRPALDCLHSMPPPLNGTLHTPFYVLTLPPP